MATASPARTNGVARTSTSPIDRESAVECTMSHSAERGFLPLMTTSKQNSANASTHDRARRASDAMSIDGRGRVAVGRTVMSAVVSDGAIAVMLPHPT